MKLVLQNSIAFPDILFWRLILFKDIYFSFKDEKWIDCIRIMYHENRTDAINALVRPSFGDLKCAPNDINF